MFPFPGNRVLYKSLSVIVNIQLFDIGFYMLCRALNTPVLSEEENILNRDILLVSFRSRERHTERDKVNVAKGEDSSSLKLSQRPGDSHARKF